MSELESRRRELVNSLVREIEACKHRLEGASVFTIREREDAPDIEAVVDFAFDGIYTAIDTAIARIKEVQP